MLKRSLTLYFIGFLLIAPGYVRSSENKLPEKSELNSAPVEEKNNPPARVFIPGDALQVSTFPDTTSILNNIYPIDDQGYIDLPIFGRMKINHLDQEQLSNLLKDYFKDYLRYPNVQVKPLIRVSVLGGAFKPGLYYFDPNRSLWDLIYLAGGTIDENGLKDMRWKRNNQDVVKDLVPIYQNGSSLKTIGFKSGDQIWVKTPIRKRPFVENMLRWFALLGAIASTYAIIVSLRKD